MQITQKMIDTARTEQRRQDDEQCAELTGQAFAQTYGRVPSAEEAAAWEGGAHDGREELVRRGARNIMIERMIAAAIDKDDGHDARYRLARLAEDVVGLGDALDTRDEATVLAASDRVSSARDSIEEN